MDSDVCYEMVPVSSSVRQIDFSVPISMSTEILQSLTVTVKTLPDVTLDQELYYKISCEPVKGYCLRVSNCSVTTDAPGQKPYLIIDGRGCTTEPSLFEHVQYEDNFTAGIYNPYPIRFRNQKSAVQFNCDTSLVLLSQDGKCQRERCVWNEYTKEANEQQQHTK
uniref:ZP domain-containing protein n=1 Tax=Meloidogyne javanica TaxID=6303 RepID=A0A915N2A8_MELJA